MLHNVLTHETCAKCRICCSFVKEDAWESPLFSKYEKNVNKKVDKIIIESYYNACKK